MDVHSTQFPENKTQSVRSKYKMISEATKQKTKEAPPLRLRRTFGTIRNPNVPEKPKTKPSNQISLKPQKTEPEIQKKTPQNESNDRTTLKKKKSVAFYEKVKGSVTKNSPAIEIDRAKTPVRPPFSTKPVRIPGTPYLSAEKCGTCSFDKLETASYWIGQIKSAELVEKHFVSAAFFRLANECKAEPARNLQTELKKYLAHNQCLATKAEWKDVSRMYGIMKEGSESTKSKENNVKLIYEEMTTQSGFKVEDIKDV